MNKIYSIILLLILVSMPVYSQYNVNYSKYIQINQMDFNPLSSVVQLVSIKYPETEIKNEDTFKCWIMFSENDSENSASSRAILMRKAGYEKSFISSLLSYTESNNMFYSAYVIDDNQSFISGSSTYTFNDLCPGSRFMITWFGSDADSSYFGVDRPRGNLDYIWSGSTVGSQSTVGSILYSIRNKLDSSLNGKVFQCFNATEIFSINTTITNEVQGTVSVCNNTDTIPFFIKLSCGNGKLSSLVDLSQVFHSDPSLETQQFEYPPSDISWINADIRISLLSTECLNELPKNSDLITSAIYGAFMSVFNSLNNLSSGKLSEIIATVALFVSIINELMNIGIIFISFYLILQVAKKYVAFTSSLKKSLINSAIIFGELLLWLAIITIFLYFIINTVSLCGMKVGMSLFALNANGIGLKTPQSIYDLPAVAYDALVIGVMHETIPECKTFVNLDWKSVIALKPQWINLGDSSLSILLRADIVLVITFLLVIVLGILWNLVQYMRRKAQTMEKEVRGGDLESEDIEEY